MPADISASVDLDGTVAADSLVVGLPHLGMASLTAVDHLVHIRELEPVGHVTIRNLPAVTPFSEGRPRNHTRLYDIPETGLALLVGELFVPVWAAESVAETLVEFCGEAGIDDLAFLHAVPYPHGEEEHDVFTVAGEAYATAHLDGVALEPLAGGFLDGLPGELLARELEGDGIPTGVFVTPTHPPGPDIEAAIRLLTALEAVYDLDFDLAALEEAAAERERQYAELATRMEQLREGEDGLGSRDYPEDRMYM